jgi:23S rRNA (adenine2503-C2)-methyltransferase
MDENVGEQTARPCAEDAAANHERITMTSVIVINNLLPVEMQNRLSGWGMPSYRTRQVLEWLYKHQVSSFEEMTNLSKDDRKFLSEHARIGRLEIRAAQRSADDTRKWLLELEDGYTVETVLIPEADHWTQCVSTQVGCAMGCAFCRTAQMGLQRQLAAWEIVEQVVSARRCFEYGDRIRNVVLMGMGEPLANYENVLSALRLMLLPEGLDLSKRRITVSTCGLLPEMRRLAHEGLGIGLAVSLNAVTNAQRSRLMPINRVYPIEALLATCRSLPLPERARITFEYILFRGVNDSPRDAQRLVQLLRGMRCKINLIPFNAFAGSTYESPVAEDVLAFKHILAEAHLTAPVRWSKGADISAACGQLTTAPQTRASQNRRLRTAECQSTANQREHV